MNSKSSSKYPLNLTFLVPPNGRPNQPPAASATKGAAGSMPSINEEILEAKAKKWHQLNQKRYGEKRKFGYVEAQKELLPPEVLRYPN